MPHRWSTSTRYARLPPEWSRHIVPRILARDCSICYICGRSGADGVDHIRRGDDHRDCNLAAVHHDVAPYCHRYKSSAEGHAARAARRAAGQHPGERHPGATP